MLLMLDRWEGFVAAFENYDYGRLIDTVLRLLREGAAVGLRAVFTGDRSGLGGQVSTVFDDRLILRMADPNDYNYAGINERHVPSEMPPGRVVQPAGIGIAYLRESQIALLDTEASGTAQVAALQRLAQETRASSARPAPSLRPLHVDELPIRVTYSEALTLDPDFKAPSPLWALIGAGGDQLGPVGADLLAEGPGFTIAGPPRSGRSNVLMTMARSLLDPDVGGEVVSVVLICPRRSPLRDMEGESGVLGVLGTSAGEYDIDGLTTEHPRHVVIVDDAELLVDTPLDEALARMVLGARDEERGLVIAGTTDYLVRSYHGFIADTLRSRSGILLAMRSSDDGDLFGLRLPRDNIPGGPLGRGLCVSLGEAYPAQLALHL
jgi:S-DNA-T family DNA segregation ATPase FtsK/SpoIIIE